MAKSLNRWMRTRKNTAHEHQYLKTIFTALFLAFLLAINARADALYIMKAVKRGSCRKAYPQLTTTAGPASEKVNAQILHMVKEWGSCDKKESDSETFLDAKLRIEAITPQYISLIEDRRDFTGGAHDNHTIRSHVYDIKTGQSLLMVKEFGGVDVAEKWTGEVSDRYESFQEKMAAFLAPRLRRHFDKCMASGDNQPGNAPWNHDVKAELIHFDFDFALKDHSVVVLGVPAHVIDICSFQVTVPYREIAPLINPGSILHAWLK